MKKFKVSTETTTFRTFLTEKSIKWEVVDNWIGTVLYLDCASDLLQIGIDFGMQLEAIEGRQGPCYDATGKMIIL